MAYEVEMDLAEIKRWREQRFAMFGCMPGDVEHIDWLIAELEKAQKEADGCRRSEKNAIKRMDEMGSTIVAAQTLLQKIADRVFFSKLPDENARTDVQDILAEETLRRIEQSPVCLGCGKRHPDCKCTDEEIEYHKRLEREQKAE